MSRRHSVNATRPPEASPPRYSRNVAFERALEKNLSGEVRFDAFTRGRYATDASIYQIMPAGVAFPKTAADVAAALQIAHEHGISVVARGGGTSQNGQAVGHGLVLDFSRHMNRIVAFDATQRTAVVEPGIVLNTLNARARAAGLFFPVEPSTASRCTLGGMVGNNSSGARSLRFGMTADNVARIDALFSDGTPFAFGAASDPSAVSGGERAEALARQMIALADAERDEIAARIAKVQRRVAGYDLEALTSPQPNLARLLTGSEGTLALSTAITIRLTPLPAHRVVGICQFPSFRAAMETTRHIVGLDPVAVELVDDNILSLGRDIAMFRQTLDRITRGQPNCLLIVEFAGDDAATLRRDLNRLDELMADHGLPDAVVPIFDPATQQKVWEVREACLNIMMSMKGDAKPVSFIEDCAVPLEHLADYTEKVTAIFERHGTRGTWYAHASVGCLHVRPILNMKTATGVATMRAIADEVCETVRALKGSYSGEHGDGISRSEYIAPMLGEKLTRAIETVKEAFDPDRMLNPGKIVRPYAMDDRSLMRFPPGYGLAPTTPTKLDWSASGGLLAHVEMCNNNGTCRKLSGGGMCPSYRATRNETDTTRGRANALRLALTGQLGADALTSPDMSEAMALCVSCKACKRECPTGVDMARLKIEWLAHRNETYGLAYRDRLVAHLPRYAPFAARLRHVLNLRDRVPGLAWASERLLGLSRARTLPVWRRPWVETAESTASRCDIVEGDGVVGDGRDVVLFADTFNRYFEPDNLVAAERVLSAGGYRLHRLAPLKDDARKRPLCCGRTYLATGQVDEARAEARRTAAALLPFVEKGAHIVGLEPSCLLTLRDEYSALLPEQDARRLAQASFLIEELLERDIAAGRVSLPLSALEARIAYVHGHCHQKALDAFAPVTALLGRIPELKVRTIDSACCGMAGAFGYAAETIEVSKAMAELSLFPALRSAEAGSLVVAGGTSCRHQLEDGLHVKAEHPIRIIERALRAR
ncbi:MAG: FAD-binding and (Fe-S)-binding domain-containing protein [Hyphomicrobium aestuarii]|nr:FAD-binding and (Fe-S)-binding domain-containing protein [Hyphomicrobium aestuarii]